MLTLRCKRREVRSASLTISLNHIYLKWAGSNLTAVNNLTNITDYGSFSVVGNAELLIVQCALDRY